MLERKNRLQKIADKLIKDDEVDLGSNYLSEEDGMKILEYIKEKTGDIFKLIINENVYSSYTDYDCYITEADKIEVEKCYWPCWSR